MGIYSRDYIRDQRPSGGFGVPGGQWAIKYLLIANITVFFLQNMFAGGPPGQGVVAEWLALSRQDLFPSFQIWRLVTYGFCHGSLDHVAFNLFVLWMFGRGVEPILGSNEFLAFYLTGVVISGLCYVTVQVVLGIPAGVIGASGGVMAVVFLTAMYFPRMKVLVMFIIPAELWLLAVLYAVIDVWGMTNPGSGVAHAAHLGGAAFGVVYRYYNWRLMPWWNRLRSGSSPGIGARKRPKVRLYRPTKESLDNRVDDILEKIHREGEASLTDEEREVLKEAGQRYKNR